MDKSTSNSKTRKEDPSEYMRGLKVDRLCLVEKFFNTKLELLVEIWKGETEDQYFTLDFAYNYNRDYLNNYILNCSNSTTLIELPLFCL